MVPDVTTNPPLQEKPIPIPRRLTVDAVLKMASTTAQKHLDAPASQHKPSPHLYAAIAATWELVKGRLDV